MKNKKVLISFFLLCVLVLASCSKKSEDTKTSKTENEASENVDNDYSKEDASNKEETTLSII